MDRPFREDRGPVFFPVGDDNPSGRRPLVTYGLIAVNVLVFVVANGWPFRGLGGDLSMSMARDFGLVPSKVAGHPFTFISSMFLHGDIFHILGNMVFLWIAGDNVEEKLGGLPFLGFYVLSGVLASATYLVYAGASSIVPLVGASGAIAGALGCYMVFFPRARIRIFYWFYFFVGIFRVEARWFLGFWIAENLFFWLVVRSPHASGVAYAAHAGGFAVGIVTGMAFKGRLRRSGRITRVDRLTGFAGSDEGVVKPEVRVTSGPASRTDEFVNSRVETRRSGQDFFGQEEAIVDLLSSSRIDAALERYVDYLRLPHAKPLPSWAQIEIAAEFFRRGDFEEALKAYRRYLAHHPQGVDGAEARFRLGVILARHRHEYFRAREYLIQATLEHPEPAIREHAKAELRRIEALM
jgi:membrane associated rhomboid family serine protease